MISIALLCMKKIKMVEFYSISHFDPLSLNLVYRLLPVNQISA